MEKKFRVWDGKNMNYCVFVGLGKAFAMSKSFVPKNEIKNAIIMQYTGIKDRTGKEIYEGDIITLFDTHTRYLNGRWLPPQDNVVVVWEENENSWRVKYLDSGNLFSAGSSSSWICFAREVIGNIYETQA